MRRWRQLQVCILASVVIAGVALADPATKVAKSVFPGTVLVTVLDSAGQPLALGSGFIAEDGVVVTNHHVIEGGHSARVRCVGASREYTVHGTVGVDTKHDLALLSVSGLKGSALKLAGTDAPEVGATVYAVGNPQGLEGTFSQGIVSGIRKIGDDRLIQITASISPGSSGGPVVDSKGSVIGVAVGTLKKGQNLNFAVPASYVSALLRSVSKKPTPLSKSTPKGAAKNVVRSVGSRPLDGIRVRHVKVLYGTSLTWVDFSIKNDLPYPVHTIKLQILFYDSSEEIVHSEQRTYLYVSKYSSSPAKVQVAARMAKTPPTTTMRAALDGVARTCKIRVLDFKRGK